jgi:hypothetical protein
MSGVIFLIQGEKLVELREEQYDSEELLQKLLADYPKILAGDQIDSENPRKWLLIAREIGVPDDTDATDRWFLDHLFIDQDGIPTFIEVKRCTDTRIRREVVAQMLDYAANGTLYWKVPDIKAQFESSWRHKGINPERVVEETLGVGIVYETLWRSVQDNLENGKIRLLFVADEIPKELKRIVEFLNEKMNDVEVLAVEVKQFKGESIKTLVPRVIGQTIQSENKKVTRKIRTWDKNSIVKELEIKGLFVESKIANNLIDWIASENLPKKFGTGPSEGNCIIGAKTKDGQFISIFSINTSSHIYVQFDRLKRVSPYNDENKRKELVSILNEKIGASIPIDAINSWPTFYISNLTTVEKMTSFQQITKRIVEEIGRY